jgi:AraC-like DNA-binding protein
VDYLATILHSVRLAGALLSRAELSQPWAVATRGAPRPIFHAIVRGSCSARADTGESAELVAGDVVVFPGGVGHVLCTHSHLAATAVNELPQRQSASAIPLITHGGGGDASVIVCGTFQLDHEGALSLLDRMPPLVRLRPERPELADWMQSTLALLDNELVGGSAGASSTVARLTDLLVMQLLRDYATRPDVPLAGWLAAVRDQHIGRALALIHGEPGADWSATRLARSVGLSRTRFFERFSELMGEPPARYVARWRASTAADIMRRRDLSVAEIAGMVGYASENAFVRAFRKYVGVTPGEYRRRARS